MVGSRIGGGRFGSADRRGRQGAEPGGLAAAAVDNAARREVEPVEPSTQEHLASFTTSQDDAGSGVRGSTREPLVMHGREGEQQVDQRHTQLAWRRSTRCSTGGCVEVSRTADSFLVRDSKQIESAILSFGTAEWMEFISAVKAGEVSGS